MLLNKLLDMAQLKEALEDQDLSEKVFDEHHYTWFEVTSDSLKLSRRGKMEPISKGDVIGIRRATSDDGKYRVITKAKGPSIIFSLDDKGFELLKRETKPMRGSL
jgi:hypothetical protein